MSRKAGRPDLSNYKHEPRVSLRVDVARFMMYARKHAPGLFFSYPEIVQRINNYSKLPRIDSHEVESVRKNLSGVRKILLSQEGDDSCTLITHPVMGMRASVGSSDVLATQMRKVAVRLGSAQAAFTLTNDLIDPREIPNTPEFAELKAWHRNSIMPVAKAISATDFATKLLPPKKEDGTEKK